MFNIFATVITKIEEILEEEIFTLPTKSPKVTEVKWVPIYNLEEVIVIE